jgi:hypothetical protein
LDLLAEATLFHKRPVAYEKECTCGKAHCQTCNVGMDSWLIGQWQMKKAREANKGDRQRLA